VVEIPKGSHNKYEYDKELGFIKMDRVLYTAMHYPGDYGMIPRTLYEDGDSLDVLVMTSQPAFPGCVIEARPLGLFRMTDQGLPDDKVLAVPATDPLYTQYKDLADIPPHFLEEVAHFFSVYKDLERVRVEASGWESSRRALQRILHAMDLYREKYGTPETPLR
jgi:inorganic pyrophosphatase